MKRELILIKSQNIPKKPIKFSLYVEILTVMFTKSMFTKTIQCVLGVQFFEKCVKCEKNQSKFSLCVEILTKLLINNCL